MTQDNLLKWEFAATGGGEETGINDPVISNFLGNVASKLVRESLQNSIDAGIERPVVVKFEMLISESSKIPGVEELRRIYDLCIKHWSDKNRDIEPIFKGIIKSINIDSNIPILKISDHNTRGLTPNDYHNLFQVVGGSSKGVGDGGSFGLGKGAYFGASRLRTVFISSKYEEDKYYFAGKSRLVSFADSNGVIMQNTGTYGYPAQKPVTEEKDIPDFFKRQEKGTDFYVYGYLEDKNWKNQILKSVLENFWYAIMQESLVVYVGDILVNHESLSDLMVKYVSEFNSKNEYKKCPFPFFFACKSPESKLIEGDLPTLGKVSLYVFKNEEFPKQIVYIRKTGMTIQQKGQNAPYGYAAVFVCEDVQGNEILRKMENPEHDKWDKDIAITSGKLDKYTANNAIRELNQFISNSLKSLQEINEGDELRIKDLDKYLWLPMDEDEPLLGGGVSEGSEKPSNTESAQEINKVDKEKTEVVAKKEKLKIAKKPVKGRLAEGEDDIIHGGNGGGGNRKKINQNGIEDLNGDSTIIQVADFKYRSFAELNESLEYEHTLIIKAPKSQKLAKIVVHVGTDNSLDDEAIKSVCDKDKKNKYDFDGSVIKDIELDENGEKKLLIKFNDGNKYSLNVIAYEHK